MSFLASDRLFYRALEEADADGPYLDWMNDPEVTCYLESRFFPQNRESIRKFIAQVNDGRNLALAACLKDTGAHIGNIKVGPINTFHRRASLGLIIGDKEQWSKGFASEMIGCVSDYAFKGLNLHKLTAGCYDSNPGSTRAFLKAGYEQEATLKRHAFCNGQWVDCLLLAKFATQEAP